MKPGTKLSAMLLALFLTAGACGLSESEDGPLPDPPTTAAATLRVTLETLFREHVYLLGLVTENVATGQVPAFQAANDALEENALALGDHFEKAYADRGEKGFLTAWRPYTELTSQYAARKARKQKLGKIDQAFAQITGRFAQFSASLTPLINARVIGSKMRDVIGSVRVAVDAQVATDFAKADASLRTAADRASELGTMFARAFADDVPGVFPGNPAIASATLRSSLSAVLTDHVYLLGYVTENALTNQPRPRDGAKGALDAAAATFAKHIGAYYDGEAEMAFLPLWMRGADLLIAYAKVAKDKAKAEPVRADLEKYATEVASFLEGLNKTLNGPTLEKIVGAYVQAMTVAIEAQAAGDFKKADLRLRAAAQQIETFGLALASATTRSFPERFRATPAAGST